MKKTCQNCKWWKFEAKGEKIGKYGRCKNLKLIKDMEAECDNDMVHSVITGWNAACEYWEKKEG